MIGKVTSNLFNSLTTLKGVITFCLLLSMLAKPVITVIFHLAAIEYEVYEGCEEKESEEKENTIDAEDEDQKHYYNIPEFALQSNCNPSLFALHKDLNGSLVVIPFPPPDWG